MGAQVKDKRIFHRESLTLLGSCLRGNEVNPYSASNPRIRSSISCNLG